MRKSSFELATFPNGLEILVVPMPGVQSVAAMVWVAAGSRHEEGRVNGIAHFLEHMALQGTEKYKNQEEIGRLVEGTGGILNAYTDSEFTSYWCKVPGVHFERGLDLISQLALYPTIPEKEIKKESTNIIEEMNRKEDVPADKGWSEFMALVYPEHPLGRETLGTKETVLSIKRGDFLEFRKQHYSPDRMTVVAAGAVSPQKVRKEVGKIFGHLIKVKVTPAQPIFEGQETPRVRLYQKKSAAQAHIYIGMRTFPHDDPDRYALAVLNSILGRGLTGRLFMNVRNKKGLAYEVSSDTWHYSDTGVWAAYAGLNTGKIEKGISGVLTEMIKMREEKVGEKELSEGKEKIRGPLLFLLENTFKLAEFYGMKAAIGEALDGPEEEAEKIMAVTPEDVRRVAQRLFIQEKLNMAVVGAYEQAEKERFLRVLKI